MPRSLAKELHDVSVRIFRPERTQRDVTGPDKREEDVQAATPSAAEKTIDVSHAETDLQDAI
jgi:hypothetical protein